MPEFMLMGTEGERLRLFIEKEEMLRQLGEVLACESILTPQEKTKLEAMIREDKS